MSIPRANDKKGATPVPVASKYRLRPGLMFAWTNVPTALLLTNILSPGTTCCNLLVNGPSCTLIL